MNLKIDVNDELLQATNMSEQDIQIELAVLLYVQDRLSFGQARKLAGMSYFEFEELLAKRNVPSSYDEKEFDKDLETIKKLGRKRNGSHL
ncbi:MAG: UPF0175 family protein [Lewinellaceae bacterium]|nr:UPF0175 family protein [Lewinellaceae bacterium]